MTTGGQRRRNLLYGLVCLEDEILQFLGRVLKEPVADGPLPIDEPPKRTFIDPKATRKGSYASEKLDIVSELVLSILHGEADRASCKRGNIHPHATYERMSDFVGAIWSEGDDAGSPRREETLVDVLSKAMAL